MQQQIDFTAEFIQKFPLHNSRKEGMLPFCKANSTVIRKPDKYTMKKKTWGILNRIPTSKIPEHYGFIPGMQCWFNIEKPTSKLTCRVKNKNYVIITVDPEKALVWEVQHSLIIKAQQG